MAALTAEMILGIPLDEPERLFPGDAVEAKSKFRLLAKQFHPDASGGSADIFERVMALYKEAERRIEAGAWREPGVLKLTSTEGTVFKIRYQRSHAFELGQAYIGNTVAAFCLERANSDLFENAKKAIASFRFPDDRMRGQIAPSLPEIVKSFATADGHVLVVKKDPDMILLKDVIAHYGGRIDPAHAAWILSSLYNLACYFEYAGITHNAVAPDTYLISPEKHSGALIGGWWYSAAKGAKLLAAPDRTIRCMPSDVLAKKSADARTDLELIRMLGREMLGDIHGTRLSGDKTVPRPMADWLRHAASGSAREDYASWMDALKRSFGERRFVKLNLSPSDIYG